MYLRDLWTSCVRRWYFVLAFVLISGAVLGFASTVVKPSYESTASLVLVPPPSPDSPTLNRYLDLGGLSDAVAVLANSMSSDQLQQEFAAEVKDADYEVGADNTTSAPILVVTSKASTRADSARLLGLVLARVPANLVDLQTALKITEASQITAVKVSQDPPKRVEKTRLRLLGALGVALLLVSALLIALIDGLLLRRKGAKADKTNVLAMEREDSGIRVRGASSTDSEHHSARSQNQSPAQRRQTKRRKQIRAGRESGSGGK